MFMNKGKWVDEAAKEVHNYTCRHEPPIGQSTQKRIYSRTLSRWRIWLDLFSDPTVQLKKECESTNEAILTFDGQSLDRVMWVILCVDLVIFWIEYESKSHWRLETPNSIKLFLCY